MKNSLACLLLAFVVVSCVHKGSTESTTTSSTVVAESSAAPAATDAPTTAPSDFGSAASSDSDAMNKAADALSTDSSPSPSMPAAAPASSAPAAGGNDPCSLISPAEVQGVTGKTIVSAHAVGGTPSCAYHDTNDAVLFISMKGTGAKHHFEQMGAGGQTIAGLGDEARWAPLRGWMFVRKGDKELTVGPGPVTESQIRALAAKIAPRL